MLRATVLTMYACTATAFFLPQPVAVRPQTVMMAGAGADDEWRKIVGSEFNLRQFMGKEGLRYNLNKNDDEIAGEGDYGLLEKMFGATSNNEGRLKARSVGRQGYLSPEKQALNEEWIAKYGYKRYYPSYLDKSALDEEKKVSGGAAAPAKAAAPAAPKISLPSFAPLQKKVVAAGSSTSNRPKAVAAAPKAAPAPAAAPKAAAPKAPVTAKFTAEAGKPVGNLDLLKGGKK